MSNAVFFNSYKLKKGVSIPDFLEAFERLNNEHISKMQGFVSCKLMVDGDTWSDALTFETMEDLKKFEELSANPDELALNFYSFLNMNSCKTHRFSIEKSL